MKNLRINKSLCKKLTAITLATTIGYTQMTQAYTVYSFSVPQQITSSISTNMSYKYSINGRNYTITRKMDNSITVLEESSEGTNTLTMDSKGNVVIKIKDNFLPKTEKFVINNFDGETLQINKQEVHDLDLKKSVNALEEYFNNVTFNDSIRGFGNPLTTREQYNQLSKNFFNDLDSNGIKIQEPQKIKTKRILPEFTKTVYASTPTTVLTPNDIEQIGIATSTVPAALQGLLVAGGSVASTGILLTTGLFIGAVVLGVVIYNNQVLFVETPSTTINDYSDAQFVSLTLEEAKQMGYVDVRTVAQELANNLNDNNPDNDYFKAFMATDGIIVIDFNKPLSKSEAVSVISNMLNTKEHIYTLSPVLAEDVIRAAGGIPGTSNGKTEYIGRAENHAYHQSYKAYDPVTKTINKELLIPNDRKGVYFWHYHFNGKKMLNGQMNNKHAWFGEPTVKSLL